MTIIILVLVCFSCILGVAIQIQERRLTEWLLHPELQLNAQYSLKLIVQEGNTSLILQDRTTETSQIVDDIIERSLYLYFQCGKIKYRFNTLTKKMKSK
jgi:hypothetical protein